MSVDLREKIAQTLAEHKYKKPQGVCSCSDYVQVGLRCDPQTHEQHLADVLAPLFVEAQASALEEAAEVWGADTWSEVWAIDDVECDVTATQSTVRWFRTRAASIRDTA